MARTLEISEEERPLLRGYALLTVLVIGVIIVLRVSDRYEASARIYVDTQSILKPLMSGLAVQPNVDQQVAMLSRTLINRPTIDKLMQTLMRHWTDQPPERSQAEQPQGKRTHA